jgi:hypothetical protein
MNTKQMTFRELLARFPDEQSCKAFLEEKRWPDGIVKFPTCGEKAYKLKARPFHYLCKSGKQSAMAETGKVVICQKKNGYRFGVITRTVFENTNYPLQEWFRVIFFMFHAKKGMSAHQIHRMIGTGSYETAWYMCTRIRAAMKDEELPRLLGEVELDETFVGGLKRNMHSSRRHGLNQRGAYLSNKTEVLGAISRKGNVVCRMIEQMDWDTYDKFVKETLGDANLASTDEAHHYRDLEKMGFHDRTVNHSKEEYVRGKVHTQSIESFWSLLKRGISGTYHKVSKKYLPCTSLSFRSGSTIGVTLIFSMRS